MCNQYDLEYLELQPDAGTVRIEAAYSELLEHFGVGVFEAGQDMSGLVRLIHAASDPLSVRRNCKIYDAKLARQMAVADAELKAVLDRQPPCAARSPALMRAALVPEFAV